MKLIASQLELLFDRARALLDQLDFPSKDEFVVAASTAIHDLRAASASSSNLAYISFRPFFILMGILGHYLAVVLSIVAKHSVAHGWIAAKEGYFQLRTATIWFVKFQRDLPLTAKYAEVGALVIIAILWLLRRHVIKQRYAERVMAWYRGKRQRALRKYHRFIEKVAKTSSFLALLLPHLFFVVVVAGTKRMIPSAVTYLATRTYLCSILSFWHPLYLTYSVLVRLSPHLRDYREAEASGDDETEKSAKFRINTVTPSRLKQQRQREIEMDHLRVEIADMLKYWVVYAILLTIARTGKLLPFIGHVLNVTVDDATATQSKGFFKKISKSGIYSKLRLPGKVVDEVKLVFFVWLRLMPTSITGDEVKGNVSQQFSKASGPKGFDRHRPVDILYRKLSPSVLSAMNSSAFLTKKALGEPSNDGSTSTVGSIIQKVRSFLDLFVMTRLISKKSQQWLITTMVESSALLPAVTTLFMPSYFTNYGVIYVSLVVPAGYSTSSCDAIQHSSAKLESMMPKVEAASRYLQFWMIHAALSLLLASFAPLLAWVPLSTHATWLIWAYAQLESTTRKIYGWFERELEKSLEDTAVVRSTRRIISALPSNVEEHETSNVPAANENGEKSKVA